jgi:uncharacterized phiE125 gp8 family phage protein
MTYDTTILRHPDGEAIHLDRAKLHCSVNDTDRDVLFPVWIAGAREQVEARTCRQLLHARYALTLPAFPYGLQRVGNRWVESVIVLPHVPLVDVVSITYVDEAGVVQTLDAADYVVSSTAEPGFVTPAVDVSWPATRAQPEAVTVTYNTGYASRCVADSAADTLTVTGPVTWAVDDPVRLSLSGGMDAALPAPLAVGTTYYVKTAAAGVYTLAATAGGATIDLTTTGTGTAFIGEVPAGLINWMLLQIGALMENREAEYGERGLAGTVRPDFIDGLLDRYRVWLP